jgi:uncharacterized protein (UPF0218 family)
LSGQRVTDYSWLQYLGSDTTKLIAIGMVTGAYVFVKGLVPIARIIADDRRDRRRTQKQQLQLMKEIVREQAKRREGSLDLRD